MLKMVVCVAILAPLLAQAEPAKFSYYENTTSLPSLRAQATRLSIVGSDTYDVSVSGAVSGTIPVPLRFVADAHGIALLAVVSNYAANGFSAEIASAVLVPGAAQNEAISGMLKLAGDNLAGINLDFENVPHALRAQYTAFASRLGAGLHAAGKSLVLSVPATTVNDPSDSWTGAYDYAALGQIADVMQIMTYDENGPWGPPGPVAGLNWVIACLTYTQSVVASGKISLGMPAYGYDWNLTANSGTQIGYNAIPALIASTGATPRWQAATASPWFTYTAADGSAHVVWYENALSTRLKASLASSRHVGSVSVWDLGMDDPAYWRAVSAGLHGAD